MKTFLRDYFVPIFLVFVLFYLAKSIFVSLILAIFISILLWSLYSFLKTYFKNSLAALLGTIFVFGLFFGIVIFILVGEVQLFLDDVGQYKQAFENLLGFINTLSGGRVQFSVENLTQYVNFPDLAVYFTFSLSTIFSYIFTIVLFVIFILMELPYLQKKVHNVFSRKSKVNVMKILSHISEDISHYFLIKFMIASANGFFSFVILNVFGVRYALFFAFVVFLLDFIPNIGALIAMLLPFVFSFIQFSDITLPFIILFFLLFQQTVMGNVVEPKIMGDRLNLSTLVILIALMFWGSLWGVIGAFLAIPLTTVCNIIFSHFETTRPISIFLSSRGKIS